MQIGIHINDVILAGGIHLLLTKNPVFKYDTITVVSHQEMNPHKKYDVVICCNNCFEHLKTSTIPATLILILPNQPTLEIGAIIRSEVGAVIAEKEISSSLPIAIQSVINDLRYFSPEITLTLFEQRNGFTQILTDRELEIALLISQGLKSSEISDKLFLSISTVATHRKHIFKKLNVHSAKELTTLLKNRV